jgi:hypothetical protein
VKKGYVYIERYGYDPDRGKSINDPYLGDVPTLGACVPNIRRRVVPGDHIFFVSGKVSSVPQFVMGGFEVAEKIPATEAYARFPKLRLRVGKNGETLGNIIVDQLGRHDPLDDHVDFEDRIENYIIGRDPVVLVQQNEIARGRLETMDLLRRVFRKDGASPINVIGRCSRLDETQIEQIRDWLLGIKRAA